MPALANGTNITNPSCHGRSWKVKQAEEIARREDESKAKREETIVKAQNAIDNFYKEYNSKKEKNIARNKCVPRPWRSRMELTTSRPQGGGSRVRREAERRSGEGYDVGADLRPRRAAGFAVQDEHEEQAGPRTDEGGAVGAQEGGGLCAGCGRVLRLECVAGICDLCGARVVLAAWLERSLNQPRGVEGARRQGDLSAARLSSSFRSPLPLSSTMSKLVFVTGNANKLREVKEILLKSAPGLFEISSRDLDLPEIQGTTQEVAKAKVEAAAIAIGGPCITEVSCAGVGEGRRELMLLRRTLHWVSRRLEDCRGRTSSTLCRTSGTRVCS